jgi:hypothetical protein
MAKAFDFEIRGIDKLQQKLAKAPKELTKRVDTEIKATVADINAEQVRRAPIDDGFLRSNTGFVKIPGLEIGYAMFSQAPYAALQEFGTGALVNIPAGLENYAAQFKGKGIRQVNIPARSFFFSPFLAEKEAMIKRIAAILKKL